MDKRQEEQKLFRWYLSKVNRRTNIPEEEVDKWFEREDDWRHLEDYGIYIEEHKDNFYGFNPYDRKYDKQFGRNYPQECAQTEEQTRRFLARSAEIVVFKVESHRTYGATLERTRLKGLWIKRLSIAAVVFSVLFVAGCGAADYFGLGRHTIKQYADKYIFSLFQSEKSYSLGGTITNNPEGKQMMYMAYQRSSNIFYTLYIDSARIINGKFTFKGKVPYPVQAFLSTTLEGTIYSHPSTTSVLYLDTEKSFQSEIDLENPFYSVVKGSIVNDDWQKALSLRETSFKEAGIITRDNINEIYKRVLDSLPADSPVNFTYLTALLFNDIGNLFYVKSRLSEMSWRAKSSPEGLRLWKIIDKTEHTGRVLHDTPEFSATDVEGNTVHSRSLIGKGKGMVVFYFWVPGGEYSRFWDYQKYDFDKLQELYKSSEGTIRIVTVCATDDADKLIEWKKIISEYEEKEGWTNLSYCINPETVETDNIYKELYLEGKLPVTIMCNIWGFEFKRFEGKLPYKRNTNETGDFHGKLSDKANEEMLSYINWCNKYRYSLP